MPCVVKDYLERFMCWHGRSTAHFRMIVKASGTGVYMQMNEYSTDLDGYEVQNIKFTLNFAQKSSIFLPLKW